MDIEKKYDFAEYMAVKTEGIVKLCGELKVKQKDRWALHPQRLGTIKRGPILSQ